MTREEIAAKIGEAVFAGAMMEMNRYDLGALALEVFEETAGWRWMKAAEAPEAWDAERPKVLMLETEGMRAGFLQFCAFWGGMRHCADILVCRPLPPPPELVGSPE